MDREINQSTEVLKPSVLVGKRAAVLEDKKENYVCVRTWEQNIGKKSRRKQERQVMRGQRLRPTISGGLE